MISQVQAPPRLLLGATLLFWGAMSGNATSGLIAALVVEGANWIRFRWDFDHTACSLAWKICMILTILAGALIWLDGDRYTALPKLMVWLPLLMMPLLFVQSYGLRDYVALNSLSFFSEHHRARNLRLGLGESVIHFNVGNPYFMLTIVAASLGKHADSPIFLPGLVLLGGWMVYARAKSRPFVFVAILVISGLLGAGGRLGLSHLYDWATRQSLDGGYSGTNLTVNRTGIGSLGRIKQSSQMLWRVSIVEGGRIPRLLRLATYNTYKGVSWRSDLPEEISRELIPEADDGVIDDFRNLATREPTTGEIYHLMREDITDAELREPLPVFQLRGAIRSEEPLPLPGDTSTVQRFEFDAIESNPLGTVRVFPKRAIIDGTVRWRDDAVPEGPPWPREDLDINPFEEEIVRKIAADLKLNELPTTAQKISRLSAWFAAEFTYTRYLTIAAARHGKPTAIGSFLTTSRRGHCEYFATAAALVLRAADVPTRYCVGYAVLEKDPKRDEFIIRGTHGHAWTRVWDEQKGIWVDFDPTPPDWLGLETRGATESRFFADTYQRFKEDFFLWRNRPANRIAATVVMWIIGAGTLLYVGRRLWKSKVTLGKEIGGTPVPPDRITALHRLEKQARRVLGPRPRGKPYAAWLRGLQQAGFDYPRLEEALEIHQKMRFDTQTLPETNIRLLQQLANEIAAQLRKAKTVHR